MTIATSAGTREARGDLRLHLTGLTATSGPRAVGGALGASESPTRYGATEGKRWLAGALKEPDRVVLRLVPDKVVAWHYGTGDYRRMQRKE